MFPVKRIYGLEFDMRLLGIFGLVVAAFVFLGSSLTADEGMWLYNQFPKQAFKEKYGYEPSEEWLKHVEIRAPSDGVDGDSFPVSSRHSALIPSPMRFGM